MATARACRATGGRPGDATNARPGAGFRDAGAALAGDGLYWTGAGRGSLRDVVGCGGDGVLGARFAVPGTAGVGPV